MHARGIQHVDLCVRDVGRSLDFYLGILGPLGLEEDLRVPSYRGTEEVVYLRFGEQNLGFDRQTAVSTPTTTWGSSTSPSRSNAVRRSTKPSSGASSSRAYPPPAGRGSRPRRLLRVLRLRSRRVPHRGLLCEGCGIGGKSLDAEAALVVRRSRGWVCAPG